MNNCIILEDGIDNKNNRLNSVKLVAAVMVMVGHAYAFGLNYQISDWLSAITDGKTDLGALAVNIFFFYSGLLITTSLMKNSDGVRFLKRRIMRIFPAFILVTLLITLVAGPVLTKLSAMEYFTNSGTYKYLLNLVCMSVHELPGVFAGNTYGMAVNGPIWTIRVELVCYLLCYAYCRAGLMKRSRIMISVAGYMVTVGVMGYVAATSNSGMAAVIMPLTMFYIGILYAEYKDAIRLSMKVTVISVVMLIVCLALRQPILGYAVFLPYILCSAAFAHDSRCKLLGILGGCSYEIYLWGGFIGQLVTYVAGGSVSPYINMLVTIPVCMILGYLTNRAVN